MEVQITDDPHYKMESWIMWTLDSIAVIIVVGFTIWTMWFAIKVAMKWENLQQRYKMLYLLNIVTLLSIFAGKTFQVGSYGIVKIISGYVVIYQHIMHYAFEYTLPNFYCYLLMYFFSPSQYGIQEARAFKNFHDISL